MEYFQQEILAFQHFWEINMLEKIWPALLNTRSQGTIVAGMAKEHCAGVDIAHQCSMIFPYVYTLPLVVSYPHLLE